MNGIETTNRVDRPMENRSVEQQLAIVAVLQDTDSSARAVPRCPARSKQSGLTLIELMIALGLGVFLLSGILQVFLGSRQSFEVIHAQAAMQEAGRFSMTLVGGTLRQAGYINAGAIDPNQGDEMAQKLANIIDGEDKFEEHWPAENNFEAGAAVYGQDSPTGLGLTDADGDSEVVSFRIQGDVDVAMTDCAGNDMPDGETDIVEMSYYVDSDDQLRCQTSRDATNPGSHVLVSGVEQMKVIYGVSDDTPPFRPIKYVDSASMGVDDWPNVVAVRLGLLTISDNTPLDRVDTTFSLLGTDVDAGADGRARRVFTQTITLRNRLFE